MKNKVFNTIADAKQIKKLLDKLPVKERMSFFEGSLEEKVKAYREELNAELIEECKGEFDDISNIFCKCGSQFSRRGDKKKNFF